MPCIVAFSIKMLYNEINNKKGLENMTEKKEFLKYANSFQAVARLRLESIKRLTEKLGNPQDGLKFIHIAGTNGKGSVCSFLQNILTDAGYVTGKYTSPNMLRVNERINVCGEEISDCDLERILTDVKKEADSVMNETGELPTQFEIWTAAAFCYFREKKCDYVVLETGLGGTRDATNIIKNPVITAITQIASDHTEYLGNTLSEIAAEKAGIIKDDGITVTVSQDAAVLKVLKDKAFEKNNTFILSDTPTIHPFCKNLEDFDYKYLKNLKISLIGKHQIQNASLAVECAMLLNIDEKFIRSGLLKARNPGRLDIIHQNPTVLFDGAHNKNGMHALYDSLMRCFPNEKICFIMGFMHDKDIDGALCELSSNERFNGCEVFTVSVKDNPRSASSEELAQLVGEHSFCAVACDNIKTAYEKAKKLEKMIVVCGSLYLYKDFVCELIDNLNT